MFVIYSILYPRFSRDFKLHRAGQAFFKLGKQRQKPIKPCLWWITTEWPIIWL